jgi:hypothetical protein
MRVQLLAFWTRRNGHCSTLMLVAQAVTLARFLPPKRRMCSVACEISVIALVSTVLWARHRRRRTHHDGKLRPAGGMRSRV